MNEPFSENPLDAKGVVGPISTVKAAEERGYRRGWWRGFLTALIGTFIARLLIDLAARIIG